jgi:hypothetical protein
MALLVAAKSSSKRTMADGGWKMDVPGRGTLNPELRTLNFELSVGFVFIALLV